MFRFHWIVGQDGYAFFRLKNISGQQSVIPELDNISRVFGIKIALGLGQMCRASWETWKQQFVSWPNLDLHRNTLIPRGRGALPGNRVHSPGWSSW